jgi:hypothetical protein
MDAENFAPTGIRSQDLPDYNIPTHCISNDLQKYMPYGFALYGIQEVV